jgi:23S rRNA (cytosine1962-C5)-methyltransferase
MQMSTATTLRITRRAADRLRAGHLWVYRTDLESQASVAAMDAGVLVTITDSREIPLGTALYSSASAIAARLISRTPALSRTQYLADLRTRIDAALQLRRELTPTSSANNAHRLIFSEADNLPGIIADRYNDLVLLQLLTQGTAQDDVRAVIVAALSATFVHEKSALTIWERPDLRIRELEELPAPAPGPLFTTHIDSIAPNGLSFRTEAERDTDQAAPTTTHFALNGLHFHYDAASGQKTGAFLDQRLNYAAAARVVKA